MASGVAYGWRRFAPESWQRWAAYDDSGRLDWGNHAEPAVRAYEVVEHVQPTQHRRVDPSSPLAALARAGSSR